MLTSEILAWLQPIETEACTTYRVAANCFAANPRLATFLQRLADDEVGHGKLLSHAQSLLTQSGTDRVASIRTDDALRNVMFQKLRELQAQAQAGTLTETDALQAIVQAEFTEWNYVFLYVLAQFREQAPAFQHIAAVIQQHEQRIRDYLAHLPEAERPPAASQFLPKVWDRRILVADDEEGLRIALQIFLRRFGQVTTVADGQEALTLAQQQFFDAIICDLEMPLLSGWELYQAIANAGSPNHDRFIFCTGNPRTEVQQLCAQGTTQLVVKPFPLEALQKAVLTVLDRKP